MLIEQFSSVCGRCGQQFTLIDLYVDVIKSCCQTFILHLAHSHHARNIVKFNRTILPLEKCPHFCAYYVRTESARSSAMHCPKSFCELLAQQSRTLRILEEGSGEAPSLQPPAR